MKHLIALMLALGTLTLVACESSETTQAVQEANAVTLTLTGMT